MARFEGRTSGGSARSDGDPEADTTTTVETAAAGIGIRTVTADTTTTLETEEDAEEATKGTSAEVLTNAAGGMTTIMAGCDLLLRLLGMEGTADATIM